MARKLRWTDVNDIAIELKGGDADNVNLRFTDLHKWVMALARLHEDDPNKSNERSSRRFRHGLKKESEMPHFGQKRARSVYRIEGSQ